MSVVSLLSRVTTDREVFHSAEKSATSLIYAVRTGAAEGTGIVSGNGLEIELTVGERWAQSLGGDQPKFYSTDHGDIKVPARASIIVETLEYIAVPNNLLGIVFPKGSLFRQTGLHPLTAKVDPTWRGNLRILLHNAGAKAITVKRGQPIASLSFLAMETTLRSSLTFPDPSLPVVRHSKLKAVITFLQNPLFIAVVTSALGAVVGALITVWATGQ